MPFLGYVDSSYQSIGSYGGHVLVVGSVKKAIWCPTSWEPPAWSMKASPLNISKFPIWSPTLSENFIIFLFFQVIRFLDVLCLFHFLRCRNRIVSISVWCHFRDISVLLCSLWVAIGAMFLLWILPTGLHCASQLRTSSLRNKYSCIHHMETLFVK